MAKQSSKKMVKDDQDVLKDIKKKIQSYYTTFNDNIAEYHRAQSFVMDDESQWTQQEKDYYSKHKRPRLTVNRLYLMVKQILGAQRMATRNITVRMIEGSPGSQMQDEVTEKRVELVENIVRTIAYNSNTDIVYQTGFKSAMFGFGGWRIGTDWESDMSFNQVVTLNRGKDPTKFYWDMSSLDPIKVDGDFCGYDVSMHKSPVKQKYGLTDKEIDEMLSESQDSGDSCFSWAQPSGSGQSEDMITICHHFQKEYYTKRIALLSNNIEEKTCDIEEVEETLKDLNDKIMMSNMQMQQSGGPSIPPFVMMAERDTDTYRINQYILCGKKILKKEEWPGMLLPIPYVEGDSWIDKKGKEHIIAFTRQAEDAQKSLNIAVTNAADLLTRFRGERYKATPASIPESALKMWTNPWEYEGTFLYNATPELPGGPEIMGSTEIPQSLFAAVQMFSEMLNQLTGRSDTVQGEQGNEVSGTAIDNRTRQSNETTFLNFDNLDRAIEHTGKVTLELIPKIYDTRRSLNVVGKDGKSKRVTINDPQDPASMITEGKYEITIQSGPSFTMQKESMNRQLMELISGDPQLMTIFGDVVVRNMDINDSQELAKRIEVILDPRVIAMTGKKLPKLPPQPPSPQQQQQQMMMQEMQIKIQQAQQDLQIKQEEVEIKKQELALKSQQAQLDYQNAQVQNQLSAGKLQIQHQQIGADMVNTHVKARAEILKQAEANHRPMPHQGA